MVRITDNTAQVKNSTNQKASIFLRLMADQIVSSAEPMTPKKAGNLRRDILKQVLGLHGKIVWSKNYAIYQEKKQYRNYTTPGTGPHFAEKGVQKGAAKTNEVARRAGLL